MHADKRTLYEVAITAIVVKEGKYLITRRSPNKKRFPHMWTVPGGRLEPQDYAAFPQDAYNAWYNVLEKTIRREVKEEVGLDIKNTEYVTSIVAVHGDIHSLIISVVAEYDTGEVTIQKDELDEYAWVTLTEAKEYDLIDGIYDELKMAEDIRRGKKYEWQRATRV